MNKLAELSRLAATLNQETDTYTKSLGELEKKLTLMNLGVEVWLPLKENSATGTPDRDVSIQTFLGYAKTDEGWGFAVKRMRVEAGFYENDRDCPWQNTYEEEPPKLLLKASRELRIEAAKKIEALLEALTEKAQELVPTLQKARGLAGLEPDQQAMHELTQGFVLEQFKHVTAATIVCESCGERIKDSGLAWVMWNEYLQNGERTKPTIVCKKNKCNSKPPYGDFTQSMELRDYLIDLLRNSGTRTKAEFLEALELAEMSDQIG